MGVTTAGLSAIAAAVGGSIFPTDVAIGISGLTFASGQTTLGSEVDRNQINTFDLTSSEEVGFYANFSANEISGTVLREFGTFNSGNQMITRQVLTGSLVFTGEQELQIQDKITFFISG